MARLELEVGTDVLLLETGFPLLLESSIIIIGGGGGMGGGGGFGRVSTYPGRRARTRETPKYLPGTVQGQPATLPELIVSKELDRLGIGYQFQQSFLGGRTQAGGAIADFTISSLSLIIRVQGDYWHSSPSVRAKDKLQNIALISQGWNVIDLMESDIIKNVRFYVSEALKGISHT